MKNKILKIKENHKEINSLIRELKMLAKESNQDKRPEKYKYLWKIQSELYSLSREIRHRHIAYCLLRGRTMEQIEPTHKPLNKPSQYLIDKYMEDYRVLDC